MIEIESIKKEYNEIIEKLSQPELISDFSKFEELNKRKISLEKIIEKEREIKEIESKIEENQLIISAKEDPELVALAESEIIQLREQEKILEKELEDLVKEKSEKIPEKGAVIVEIRAGTGGKEACLFVADLFRMYSKYARAKNYKVKILDSRETELGGFKEVIFEMKGSNVFSKMKNEGGVHRVQRIPKTEKAGRIHTSTVSVAILERPEPAEIKIRPEDLRIDFYRASGPGGQYVNRRETAVRICHLPSGLVVTSQTERNQLQNKENALAILEARLLERKKMAEFEEMAEKRKAQIKWAKRAEKIRTYNFPQDRLTDHRIKKSWKNLEKILNGELDPVIEALEKSVLAETGN